MSVTSKIGSSKFFEACCQHGVDLQVISGWNNTQKKGAYLEKQPSEILQTRKKQNTGEVGRK